MKNNNAKDNTIYLKNIIDKAREANAYCNEVTGDEFLKDDKTKSAVILKLIVIGEEAKKLPQKIKSEIDLPWKMIIGFRNIAIHEYFDIDVVEVYKTVKDDIPYLIIKIEDYLKTQIGKLHLRRMPIKF